MTTRFSIYKGLQKPLVYRGFKGKFIVWGIGSLVFGLISGGLIGATINMTLGGFLTIGLIAAGLTFTFFQQKKGLHSKSRHKGIFIHPVNLKSKYANFTQNGL